MNKRYSLIPLIFFCCYGNLISDLGVNVKTTLKSTASKSEKIKALRGHFRSSSRSKANGDSPLTSINSILEDDEFKNEREIVLQGLSERHVYEKLGDQSQVLKLNKISKDVFLNENSSLEEKKNALDLFVKITLNQYTKLILTSDIARGLYENSKGADEFYSKVADTSLTDLPPSSLALMNMLESRLADVHQKCWKNFPENPSMQNVILECFDPLIEIGLVSGEKVEADMLPLLESKKLSLERKKSLAKKISLSKNKSAKSKAKSFIDNGSLK